jgi:peptidoglycan/xylan/chitin deacetylase (PgdA/CDA1 family)
VRPESVPSLRAPVVLAASLAFLVLVGLGPALSAPSQSGSASGGGGGTPDRAAVPGVKDAHGHGRAIVGCRPHGASFRRSGSRHRRLVGLGFDDGPSPYTERFVKVLRRNRATATFFEVGRNVPGHGRVMRQILANGNAIGNHSLTHANLAGGGAPARYELRRTQALIHHETGYRPCLFRPPYGAVSANLVREARRAGMLTIQWNVDPHDYVPSERPRYIAGAVSKSVRRGSIVVMHDGGGDRTRTLRSLNLLLHRLHRHGFKVVAIDKMLGLKRRYA